MTAAVEARSRRLDGQVAVITVAGGGIGRGISTAFADARAKLVLVDIDETAVTETEAKIKAEGAEVIAMVRDVTDQQAVDDLFSAIEERFRRVDILVNNAAVIDLGSLLDITLAQLRRVFRVNVEGPLLVTQGAAQLFLRQGEHPETGRRGTIVNIGSPTGQMRARLQPSYGASKAALTQLTRMSAAELEEAGVAVSVLYPVGVPGGFGRAGRSISVC